MMPRIAAGRLDRLPIDNFGRIFVLFRTSLRYVLAVVIVLATASLVHPARGQDRLAAFMQAKLEHSQKTLEGLTKADFDGIIKHSQAISLLCEDEMWAVLKTPEYYERSKEFKRTIDAITDAARKKNLEAATLAYVDATMKCVTCHKYVRQTKASR